MHNLTAEQQETLEKLAFLGAAGKLLSGGAKVGAGLMKPVEWLAKGLGIAGKPLAKGVGAAASPIIKGTNKVLDHAVVPAASAVGKGVLGGVTGAAGVVGGAAGKLGEVGINYGAAPIAKMVGKSFKDKPMQSALAGTFGYMGIKDIARRGTNRRYTTAPNQSYLDKKRMYNKVGSEMTPEYKEELKQRIEKNANMLGLAKKMTAYGGSTPGLLGLAAAATIPMMAMPTISAFGERIKQGVIPLSSRINEDEEIAKKQIGMVTTHQMEQQLGQHSATSRSFQAMPTMERNLKYYVEHDPIIREVVEQDPLKYNHLQDTLHTVYDFAPDIATNRQAAQSILRESAMSPDGGLDYNTVKLIADTQKAISGGRG